MMRRSRGRGNNGGQHNNGGGGGGRRPGGGHQGGVPSRGQLFDSNGPEVRIRGNAFQVYDKYQALARDAQSAGDRVKAENYLQHAEHYYRIILAIQEATGETYRPRGPEGPEGESVEPLPVEDPANMPQPGMEASDSPVTLVPPPAAAVA